MKPFLLLQSRPESEASNDEYHAFQRYSGLDDSSLRRWRIEQTALPTLTLDEYSGIIVGGSPFNFTSTTKSSVQQRVESEMHDLITQIIDADFPFLGACYGVGLLTSHQKGVMSEKYAEPVGACEIEIVANDPLLANMPRNFRAFLGHKEACEVLPGDAILLARSATCPIEMFRLKNNIYATQFHPELDADGLETRIHIYRNHGYFKPEEADKLIKRGHNESITEPMKILQNFVRRYQR